MAFGAKKDGGDMVLESRHLIGLFLLMVVISGVVFTLGYVLGRSQYDAQVRAAIGPNKAKGRTDTGVAPTGAAAPAAGQPAGSSDLPAAADWDFYRSGQPNKAEDRLQVPTKSAAAPSKSKPAAPSQAAATPTPAKGKSLLSAPLVPRGAYTLQVAALTREGDALALAEALQQKKFPAFVLTPGADHYYRVQVGPYADAQSVTIARRALEHEGFKALVKH